VKTHSGLDLLVAARRDAGLTQAQLARRSGITQSVLSAYERGRRQPSVAALARILEAAGFALQLRRNVDPSRAGRLLVDVLDLADALPKRPRGELRYPRLS
jgi:transcriptional regulator with XRE-family HTH domain